MISVDGVPMRRWPVHPQRDRHPQREDARDSCATARVRQMLHVHEALGDPSRARTISRQEDEATHRAVPRQVLRRQANMVLGLHVAHYAPIEMVCHPARGRARTRRGLSEPPHNTGASPQEAPRDLPGAP